MRKHTLLVRKPHVAVKEVSSVDTTNDVSDKSAVRRSLGLKTLENELGHVWSPLWYMGHHMQTDERQPRTSKDFVHEEIGAKRPDAVGEVEPYHEASPSSTHRRVATTVYQGLLRDYPSVCRRTSVLYYCCVVRRRMMGGAAKSQDSDSGKLANVTPRRLYFAQ